MLSSSRPDAVDVPERGDEDVTPAYRHPASAFHRADRKARRDGTLIRY